MFTDNVFHLFFTEINNLVILVIVTTATFNSLTVMLRCQHWVKIGGKIQKESAVAINI